MSEQNHQHPQPPTPFFARYLEAQLQDLSEAEIEAISGGGMAVTLAYPSDQEGVEGGVVTQKYPSDHEDVSDGTITTKKYPSDQEDSGFNIPFPNFPGFNLFSGS
ncbi:microviridin/marinostatin family tricyclic proteinase inhibitor [Calothrix sp. NIES-3974]|uniref:microviridin/marinostatin family tricyclic proteinase inhibitor n=1 Tax=Calothrix sp. NIES-3974 TaxID=2005462 RepID=UPI000B60C2A0|nr:microviridin/marinostatin family tricyclic proteinase inhibitor [Calothrix sp. NIES-3974]BAZ07397.1 hypothetical protein NIES3974_40600 [Calothrix sp. NIES-3974]